MQLAEYNNTPSAIMALGVFIARSFHCVFVHAVAVVGVAQGQHRGGDRIQAKLQRQLDAWLAENPDWNK